MVALGLLVVVLGLVLSYEFLLVSVVFLFLVDPDGSMGLYYHCYLLLFRMRQEGRRGSLLLIVLLVNRGRRPLVEEK